MVKYYIITYFISFFNFKYFCLYFKYLLLYIRNTNVTGLVHNGHIRVLFIIRELHVSHTHIWPHGANAWVFSLLKHKTHKSSSFIVGLVAIVGLTTAEALEEGTTAEAFELVAPPPPSLQGTSLKEALPA